jgi:CBS domain-containing protein
MLAKDIMSKDSITVPLDAKISDVYRIIRENNILGVPVINGQGVACGLITERELFSGDYQVHYPTYIRLLGQTDFVLGGNKSLPYEAERITRITAEEIMNKQSFFAPVDMELDKLAANMLSQNAGLAPVVDSANHLLGSITKDDLLRVFSGAYDLPKAEDKPHYIDREFDFVQRDLSSRFAFVAKARANVWLTTATILFIIGFLAGMVYVVNPQIFIKK